MSGGSDASSDILEIFKRCDRTGRGEIERVVIKKVLYRLNSLAWTDAKVEELLSDWSRFKKIAADAGSIAIDAENSSNAHAILYEDFIFWLFSEARLPSSTLGVDSQRVNFTLMTFNVEEYWHGSDTPVSLHSLPKAFQDKRIDANGIRRFFQSFKAHIFYNIAAMRKLIEENSPDVLCLEEHSMGMSMPALQRWQLDAHIDEDSKFGHDEILAALLPSDYGIFVQPTGEFAKFSGIANAVAWKKSKFEMIDETLQVGAYITPPKKPTTRAGSFYTPRSVACVQLRLVGVANAPPVIVCATHLMGGRFEDQNWAVDNEVGINERVNQVCAIEKIIHGHPAFTRGAPSIIAGDFNVMKKGFTTGPFAKSARDYVFGGTILYSQRQLDTQYLENYVPYQIAVHKKLEVFGYRCAYGCEDDQIQMKTSLRGSGCVDWIYIRGLTSLQDERIISSKRTDVLGEREITDHDAVIVTLSLNGQDGAR